MLHLILSVFLLAYCSGTIAPANAGMEYQWSRVTPAAGFPEAYNYPVFVWGNKMVALNKGTWISNDGRSWKKAPLSDSGHNSAYLKYAQFKGSVYALGSLNGNYERFTVTPYIRRTRDLETWETLAENSNLPQRIFYGSAVFDNKIWIVGGYDGQRYLNDVWNSADGVKWQRVATNAPWSPRNTRIVVFKGRMWLLGGGVIDGHRNPHPGSDGELWSSTDGVNWEQAKVPSPANWAGTAAVYDGKMWLIGANRNDGSFSNAVRVSSDMINWETHPAPWSPRGGTAVWEFDGKLFMTGGKFSHVENGEIKFVYSNDVWVMERKTE